MKCSHNELASLIKKAAMGQGFPEGLAKELAFAVLCLPDKMAETALDGLLSKNGWCVAENGPALFDRAFMALSSGQAELYEETLENIDCPKLLEGMARAAAFNYGLATEIQTKGDVTKTHMRLNEIPMPSPHSGAIEVPNDIYHALNGLAEKTYVPATAASRLKGAGAGLTDND